MMLIQDDEDSVRSGSDDESSSVSESRGSTSEGTTSRDPDKEEELAKKESRAVFRLRLLVVFVLFLAAIAVSLVVYFTTHQGETDQLQTQYEGAANKVIEAFDEITAKMGGISALGVALTAHAIDNINSWPFVTLSSFQERASTARSQSGASYIAVTPIVTEQNRAEWDNYSLTDPDGWIEEGLAIQMQHTNLIGLDLASLPTTKQEVIPGPIWTIDWNTLKVTTDPGPGPYLPNWQISPIFKGAVNLNSFRVPFLASVARTCIEEGVGAYGEMVFSSAGGPDSPDPLTGFTSTVESYDKGEIVEYEGDPFTHIFIPVFDSFNTSQRHVVGLVFALINWGSFFENILPQNTRGITLILENPCYSTYTYQIDGQKVQRVGPGDLHDPKFHYMEKSYSLANTTTIPDGTETGITINHGSCPYSIRVYPSQEFHDQYVTNTPVAITMAVAMIFVFTAAMFFVYDRLVERRQRLVMRKAIKTSAIVASLFPKNVRERLMQDDPQVDGSKKDDYVAPKHRLKSFLGGASDDADNTQKPIADLFPHATVLFADIAGFTAWSSTRDPTNVFVLLQSVYQAFDALAQRRRVFKVETIGDSYVAVTGVPEPQANHAVIMAKFAADCMERMKTVTRELELTLGPGTGDLAMRFGMHSGPVTAGVLRGDRSRFQLFGDTVNTAARMESTGIRNKIQASQATVDLLIAAGKDHWVTARNDSIEAKGKGVLKTFWIMPTNKRGESTSSNESTSKQPFDSVLEHENVESPYNLSSIEIERRDRLIDWMAELLKEYVKPMIVRRKHAGIADSKTGLSISSLQHQGNALDEVREAICLPDFDHEAIAAQNALAPKVILSQEFSVQLREYVAIIASMYRSNPFHNFEHACHVTMAVHKFIQRIATPDISPETSTPQGVNDTNNDQHLASQLHEYTHGITSDPVALFAIVFSALIHDVDHRGVSNVQLMKEEEKMASFYKNKSVAEQNSLSLAWDLLMSDGFELLRNDIFGYNDDLQRFRQVVVNVVLATDIFDKELNDLRKARWNKAFSSPANQQTQFGVLGGDRNNLRATIVIEHIIQASDVSHTMQHWHIYRKWNMKLFKEMTLAYRAGRMGADPSKFWYEGELGFFDNYVIPLAKKLKDCNVFGVSSDECLNYALCNRAEWEERGQQIVAELVGELNAPGVPKAA